MAPRGHSFAVGGSSAQRLIECPANVQERLRLPPQVNLDSARNEEAAFRGTYFHDLMEGFFRTGSLPVITDEDRNVIHHAYDMVMAVVDAHCPDAEVFGVEIEVDSILPGQFGTADLVMTAPGWLVLADWKFGGWLVHAMYGNRPNDQLMFYLSSLHRTYPALFEKVEKILLVIGQPDHPGEADHVIVTPTDIDVFEATLTEAFVIALNPRPPHKKGDWCGFCAAKTICPLWTGPGLDLSMLKAPDMTVAAKPKPYGQFLSAALDLIAGLNDWSVSVLPAAHNWLSDGHQIPGWRLAPKRATRKWTRPEPEIQAGLLKLGHRLDKIAPPTLLTPAQMEKAIGTLPQGYVVAESSGFNVVPMEGHVIGPRAELADKLKDAVDKLDTLK